MKFQLAAITLLALINSFFFDGQAEKTEFQDNPGNGFANAYDFGFLPDANGSENRKALQDAINQAGTIVISKPGTYPIAGTVYIGSNTSLVFGNDVFLIKVDENGYFTHVFLNKNALAKSYDHNITIEGLHIFVNGIDKKQFTEICGLRGQIAFFISKTCISRDFDARTWGICNGLFMLVLSRMLPVR
jgi:hypothetical protein